MSLNYELASHCLAIAPVNFVVEKGKRSPQTTSNPKWLKPGFPRQASEEAGDAEDAALAWRQLFSSASVGGLFLS